ncbi:MAG: enoyl-CoA hydratase/isomerase family protein [Rhodospirillales bacterium]|nr:enoyl-CoA hydratase/isomerase family protein [Rhodospirillales bacterium]
MIRAEILKGGLARLTLDRPQAMNAVTLAMVGEISEALTAWQDDPRVRAVLVRGAGDKGLSAGGDVVELYEAERDGRHELFVRYNQTEYGNIRRIRAYPKPYIAFMDGIVMGGGVGLSIHGAYRVLTERTRFAMPEAAIGYFPDVVSTHTLPRLQGGLGYYLGLTAKSIGVGDCWAAGIGTHVLASDRLDEAEARIREGLASNADADVTVQSALDGLAIAAEPAKLAPHHARIARAFAAPSVEAILERLDEDESEWAQATAQAMIRLAPFSLKVTLALLREGAHLDFEQAMRLEYRVGRRMSGRADFQEGVKAVLVAKGTPASWAPARLADIADHEIAACFAPLPRGEGLFGE